MHLDTAASKAGNKPAVIIAETGKSISYHDFNQRSLQVSRWFWEHGLRFGDHIALMMENTPDNLILCTAALRSGLYITPVNWHLAANEAAFVINDCGARVLFISEAVAGVARQMANQLPAGLITVSVDGTSMDSSNEDNLSLEKELSATPASAAEGQEQLEGSIMLYSSGTTGKPKGILQPLLRKPVSDDTQVLAMLMQGMYQFDDNAVYLCPAPLYHAAPLGWSLSVLQLGGTVVLEKRFNEQLTLQAIDKYKITHAQFAPIMFVRLLKLPTGQREGFDLSTLKAVIHAAAPCPVNVKHAMIDWWGPIIYEYYAGSEGGGFVAVGPEEWLQKPGTVGKALMGVVHIVDDETNEVATGETGTIYFESDARFEYHGDKKKTEETYNAQGWNTLGDLGYLDEDGYLFLTDRKSFMIISGGVNIYPQETENVLTLHPKVYDVAVIGIPHEEYGEEVKAVVQLTESAEADADTEQELIDFCLENLSKFKCPRSVDFVDDMPRLPTGKLLKRTIRDRYWPS